MGKRYHTSVRCLVAAVLATATFDAAEAADATPSDNGAQPVASEVPASDGLTDIVVTARRKSEALQTTPISVTAFTSAALEQGQISGISSLQSQTPGLVVTSNQNGLGLSLRGQVQGSSDSSVDQSVGLYLDGVYIARQMGGNFDLIDIQRVEVLHGPQGTLFGRNTTGGAVNIVTNSPTNVFEGSIAGGAGNYDQRELTGIVNVPLGDDAAFRVVGRHSEHSGYGRDVFLHRDVADDNYDHVRASLKLGQDQGWSAVVTGEYIDRANNGPAVHLHDYKPTAPAAAYVQPGFYDSASELDTYERVRMYNATGTITGHLASDVTLKSITGYRSMKVHTLTDYDTSPLASFFSQGDSHIDQVSQELQLLGNVGRLEWVAGGFYFKEYGDELLTLPNIGLHYNARIAHESYAPYGQVTYQAADKLRLTGGLRYTRDKRRLRANNQLGATCFISADVLTDPAHCVGNRKLSDGYFSYTASADYQMSSMLFLYARTSMAHKSGGFNKATNGLQAFAPEKVTDYEVGFKADLLDRKLRLNVAAFWANYRNMQRPILSNGTSVPISLTQSVGRSRLPGFEVSVAAAPISGLELDAGVGAIFPKYLDFSDATGDRTGEPFTRVSKLTWSLAGTYKIPVAYGAYTLHADYGHQSPKYFFPSVRTRQGAYGLLNARAALELNSPGVELALWGKNLTKAKYNVDDLDFYNSRGLDPAFRGDPRTYGATVTYRFGG